MEHAANAHGAKERRNAAKEGVEQVLSALFAFSVFFLQVRMYSVKEILRTFNQLLRVLHGENVEILIIAAVTNQRSIGDQLAEFAWQDFSLISKKGLKCELYFVEYRYRALDEMICGGSVA